MRNIKVQVDTSELTAFADKIAQLSSIQTEAFYQLAARDMAKRLLALVIPRTPVGDNVYEDVTDDAGNPVTYKRGKNKGQTKQRVIKNGGTLRRGWTAKTYTEAKSGAGNTDAGEYANGLDVYKVGTMYRIKITNPVEYASYVEYGHRQTPGRFVPAIGKRLVKSWVEGQFFLELSETELKTLAPAALTALLDTFLRTVF